MIKIASPNFDKRPKGVEPSIIVIHYTGMGSALEALEALCDPVSKVSAHYFIDEDGSVLDLVKEEKRAWHAGMAFWRGSTDVNSRSIGIELVNPGHEFGYRAFTEAQMKVLIDLCAALMKKYKIPAYNIVGHSDVSPERKTDPGELFDWKKLALNGVGLWPNPTAEEVAEAEEMVKNEYAFQHTLYDYGYNPLAAYIDVVRAFHRHFYPEKFEEDFPDDVDSQSVAKLLSLINQSRESRNL